MRIFDKRCAVGSRWLIPHEPCGSENRQEAMAGVIESDPVAESIRLLADPQPSWKGTAFGVTIDAGVEQVNNASAAPGDAPRSGAGENPNLQATSIYGVIQDVPK